MANFQGELITEGYWQSQTLERNLGKFPSASFNNFWGEVSFDFEAGDAYSSIHVDILNSSGSILLSDINLTELDNRKKADLSVLPSVRATDIKIQIRLRAATKSPVIRNIQVLFQDTLNA